MGIREVIDVELHAMNYSIVSIEFACTRLSSVFRRVTGMPVKIRCHAILLTRQAVSDTRLDT